jgi:XRE family transcriptional regulator, fatty acid utilization regulator
MDDGGRRKILAGARLRKLRTELGLSQSAMATELGISVSYLNLIERNQRPVTAQLLIRLSQNYAIDARSFAGEDDARAATELDEIFSDPLFQSMQVPRAEIRAALDAAPSLVGAIKRLYAVYNGVAELQAGAASQSIETERGDPATSSSSSNDLIEKVRTFLQLNNNHFPEIEEAAEGLADELTRDGKDTFNAIADRLSSAHGLRVQVMPRGDMGTTLRHLDRHRRKLMISELVEPAGRTFQAAFQLGLLEADGIFETISARMDLNGAAAQRFGRITLANYYAAALMMPYQRFLDAAETLFYDVEVLGARFSASFEQVAHRLTTLARPQARGIPFFMIRVDNAGNVSKRFSSGAFPFSRFGGTCPRWNIHNTFRNPGRIEPQVIALPDGKQWFSIARTVRRVATPWGEPDAPFSVGLGCEIKHAHRLIYSQGMNLKTQAATEIGVNCRLCERLNCIQRAAPPLLRQLDVSENTRGFSPFGS